MAEGAKRPPEAPKLAAAPMEPVKAGGNPALRMMGLPRLRAKLPSRNWLIFLSITSSFASAIVYDRRHKKKAQQKWCRTVSHLAQEPLAPNQIPRKFTIVLSAPPGDTLRTSREYFTEYIKPILVAAAMDWDVIEGRREGEVRAGLAERIRKLRKKNGEKSPTETEPPTEDLVEQLQENFGLKPAEGLQGDLVIGRHTWKEYIRGLHEGWLGPLDPPPEPTPPPISPSSDSANPPSATPPDALSPLDSAPAPSETPPDAPPPLNDSTPVPPKTEPPTKPSPQPPHIQPPQYPTAPLAPTTPPSLPPSYPLPQPHILGFRNTPIRLYRFLTQRHLADQIGHQVADMVLAASTREFSSSTDFASAADVDAASPSAGSGQVEGVVEMGMHWEQQGVLVEEEGEWHKSVWKVPKEGKKGEGFWKEGVVVDGRVGERMRAFVGGVVGEGGAVGVGEGEDMGKREVGWRERVWRWWSGDDGRVRGWEMGLVGGADD